MLCYLTLSSNYLENGPSVSKFCLYDLYILQTELKLWEYYGTRETLKELLLYSNILSHTIFKFLVLCIYGTI